MRWLRLALALGVVLSMPLWAVTEDATAAETAGSVKALALQWFDRLQKGVIDRSQLAPEYSAQLTAAAIQAMAKYLNDHAYGVPPEAAEIVSIGSQTCPRTGVQKGPLGERPFVRFSGVILPSRPMLPMSRRAERRSRTAAFPAAARRACS